MGFFFILEIVYATNLLILNNNFVQNQCFQHSRVYEMYPRVYGTSKGLLEYMGIVLANFPLKYGFIIVQV